MFKVGDVVIAVCESHGWGLVNKGDRGVVRVEEEISFYNNEEGRIYVVDFKEQSGWIGFERCFEKVINYSDIYKEVNGLYETC